MERTYDYTVLPLQSDSRGVRNRVEIDSQEDIFHIMRGKASVTLCLRAQSSHIGRMFRQQYAAEFRVREKPQRLEFWKQQEEYGFCLKSVAQAEKRGCVREGLQELAQVCENLQTKEQSLRKTEIGFSRRLKVGSPSSTGCYGIRSCRQTFVFCQPFPK